MLIEEKEAHYKLSMSDDDLIGRMKGTRKRCNLFEELEKRSWDG